VSVGLLPWCRFDTLRAVFLTEALVPLGRTIVQAAFRGWLARRQRAEERSLPLAEQIDRQVTDAIARRKTDREIERMVDSVAERLRPLVEGRYADLPENEVIAVLDAVADTLAIDLSDLTVLAADANPSKLARKIRERDPDRPVRDQRRACSYHGRMSLTVDLPDAALRRLTAEADRQGVPIDEVIADLARSFQRCPTGSQGGVFPS
jgi:hypothetical protein